MPDTIEAVDRPVTRDRGDRAWFRLAAFGALLVVVLFAGYGIGRLNAFGTTSAPAARAPAMAMDESQPHQHTADGSATQGSPAMGMGSAVGGLSISSGGLSLAVADPAFVAGRARPLSFRITNASGTPITTFAEVHDKQLHLVVVRRDLTGFQHLHPTMAPDGTWSIDLTLAAPGSYRAIADFTAVVGGNPVAATLGADLTVAGRYAPVALPAPVHQVGADGFQVAYAGTPHVESTQPLLITVTAADGTPATLEPYLGAYGHLVVLRAGDVAYLHVHPESDLMDGKVRFWLAAPSPGTYRMFFDFQVAGKVHTAAWTGTVT
jgi:hypothetical protein